MSSNHHNENDPQALYEGDQSKLYSGLMSHHDDIKSEESKKQIKRIIMILILLSIVTIIEVGFGLLFSYTMPRGILNTIFLGLTIFKAFYIVKVFMHLGDEVKGFVYFVLLPLGLFIWFIIAFLYDGDFWLMMNNTTPVR